jgi:hypothetical protein
MKVAYRLKIRKSPDCVDLFRIFETGPDVKPATVADQRNFFEKWLKNEHRLKMIRPEFLQTIFIANRPPVNVWEGEFCVFVTDRLAGGTLGKDAFAGCSLRCR